MGVSRSLLIFALVVAIAPAVTLAAMQYIVGDDVGWKLNFDYDNWAKVKQFMVGDTLVFNYNKTAHNVYKVNGTEFQNCTVPKNESLGFHTGNDVFTLATPGAKWYICGVPTHCGQGMRLKLTVQNSTSTSSAPAAFYAKHPIFHIFLGMIFAIVTLVN